MKYFHHPEVLQEYNMWKSYYKAMSIIDSLKEAPVIEDFLLNALKEYKVKINVKQYEAIKVDKTDMA